VRFFVDLISKKKTAVPYDIFRGLLWLLSLVFSFLVLLRLKLYAFGLKKSFRPSAVTISIGNITAGGTGKTPCTILLAQKLCEKFPIDGSVAILTRGYKGKFEHTGARVEANMMAVDVGDEALLMAKKVPSAAVYVGEDRVQSSQLAEANGAKWLLLDDGMQHLKIKRDCEIVIIDCEEPFGYGYLLPRGLLREPLSSLTRADYIVLNRIERARDITSLESKIRKFSQAPFIKTTMAFDGFYDLLGNKKELLPPTKVGLFCGIGKPEVFASMVASLGFEIVSTHFLSDHEPIDKNALTAFYELCKKQGAYCLLCTEKDAVKLAASEIPVYSVNAKLHIIEGKPYFDQILNPGSSSKK
jgi:tetraacyldisaccharide 4'-kinase